MTDWWRALENELERRGDTAPDPWSEIDVSTADVALTSEQKAFLEQITAQPIHGVDDDPEPLGVGHTDAGTDPLGDESV